MILTKLCSISIKSFRFCQLTWWYDRLVSRMVCLTVWWDLVSIKRPNLLTLCIVNGWLDCFWFLCWCCISERFSKSWVGPTDILKVKFEKLVVVMINMIYFNIKSTYHNLTDPYASGKESMPIFLFNSCLGTLNSGLYISEAERYARLKRYAYPVKKIYGVLANFEQNLDGKR